MLSKGDGDDNSLKKVSILGNLSKMSAPKKLNPQGSRDGQEKKFFSHPSVSLTTPMKTVNETIITQSHRNIKGSIYDYTSGPSSNISRFIKTHFDDEDFLEYAQLKKTIILELLKLLASAANFASFERRYSASFSSISSSLSTITTSSNSSSSSSNSSSSCSSISRNIASNISLPLKQHLTLNFNRKPSNITLCSYPDPTDEKLLLDVERIPESPVFTACGTSNLKRKVTTKTSSLDFQSIYPSPCACDNDPFDESDLPAHFVIRNFNIHKKVWINPTSKNRYINSALPMSHTTPLTPVILLDPELCKPSIATQGSSLQDTGTVLSTDIDEITKPAITTGISNLNDDAVSSTVIVERNESKLMTG